MSRPKIAVVGSVDETRAFDPPVTDPAAARLACEEIGQELAEAGWDLIVYSGNPLYVEADVVRGYLRSTKALPGSVEVRAPLGKTGFDEFATHAAAFDIQPDPSADWEVSFYRSLVRADGVLLVGGGRSTLITGLIALTMGIPVMAVAAFGGNARKVWGHLANDRNNPTAGAAGTTTTADGVDVAAMAGPWQDTSARRLVRSVVAQRHAREQRARDEERRVRRESRRTRIGLAVVVTLLLLAVAGLAVAWGSQLGTGPSIAVLVLLPTLAGAAGALIRTVLDQGRDWGRAAVLGGAAGLITGLLYVADRRPTVLDTVDTSGVRAVVVFRAAHRVCRRPDLRRGLGQQGTARHRGAQPYRHRVTPIRTYGTIGDGIRICGRCGSHDCPRAAGDDPRIRARTAARAARPMPLGRRSPARCGPHQRTNGE